LGQAAVGAWSRVFCLPQSFKNAIIGSVIIILHFMQEIIYLGQIILAALLGGVLGWQRERWGKSAGPRTYALVTAGSALFTVLSVQAFGLGDAGRVAAQIVTGIGFLGAGTILHKKDHTEGLTTAAGLWMTAAIGMAVGVGYYLVSVASTFFILILLMVDDDRLFAKKGETRTKSQ